jgi:hypothetical protein
MSSFGSSVASPQSGGPQPIVNGRILVKHVLTGFGEIVDRKIPENTTARAFAMAQPSWQGSVDSNHIMVNGKSVPADYVLQHGDEVSVSPKAPKNA